MRFHRSQLRLYLVTDPQLCSRLGLVETVRRAVAGGVTMVQLRDKNATTAERVAMARALKQALAGSAVPIVVNDDVTAAREADVDGAHIGQGDISVAEARGFLGPDKMLGLSCETARAVAVADPGLIDYLGLGPVFATATKSDHKTPIGFAGLAQMIKVSALPAVAIGGLKAEHAAEIRASGADGMAVVSAICGTADPESAARAFSRRNRECEI